VGIYDRTGKTVVFQYQSFTESNPYAGNKLLQKTSTDEGSSWGVERDVTSFIAKGCNSGPGGRHTFLPRGRLQPHAHAHVVDCSRTRAPNHASALYQNCCTIYSRAIARLVTYVCSIDYALSQPSATKLHF
jgi:hypothetical protein